MPVLYNQVINFRFLQGLYVLLWKPQVYNPHKSKRYFQGVDIMDIDKNKIYSPDMPMGLDFALAQNEAARDYFYSLPESAQGMIISQTHTIESKEEMQAYVDSFVGRI